MQEGRCLIQSFRRTKIVATLGPASSEPDVLRRLIDAGVDVCRLNFSHGSHEEKARLIGLIREVSKEAGKPVGILQDLQGPKIRVGPLTTAQIDLHEGGMVRIYGDTRRVGDESGFAIEYEPLHHEVRPGNYIFIDDGLIELQVERIVDDVVE